MKNKKELYVKSRILLSYLFYRGDYLMKKPSKIAVLSMATAILLNVSSIGVYADSQKNLDVNSSIMQDTILESGETYDGIEVYGLDKPSTSSFQNLNNGSLSFSGKAEASTLYSNKHFKGKSTINYTIKNYGSKRLVVKIYKSGSLFATETLYVNANSSATGKVTGLDSSSLYYLKFEAPSNFSGTIS